MNKKPFKKLQAKHKSSLFTPFNIVFTVAVVSAMAYGANQYFSHHGLSQVSTGASSKEAALIKLPSFSPRELKGESLFNENCSACHGKNASGSENGPPLIHRIYEPSHHGDKAFYRAAANGVQAHHWRFGNMPKVETVNEPDVKYIIAYVRSVQRENGIN